MIKRNDNYAEEQAKRLRIKTQEHRLANLAVDGAGLSPWEAEELVNVVREVYFSEPQDSPIRSGQMYYECTLSSEGAGKALRDCQLARVLLTIHHSEDEDILGRQGANGLRRHRILRLSEEAREQDGLLTQEDLSKLLFCDVRTIRRNIKRLRESGIIVATRGQQKDIGPGVTHRGVAIRLWVDGKEPVDVARNINHSLTAIERYLQTFSRIIFLKKKDFDAFQIALTLGVSVALTKTYLEVYEQQKKRPEFLQRLEEIEIVGGKFYETQDLKKGVLLQKGNAKRDWSKQ